MPAAKPAPRTRAKSPPRIVNKGGACAHFGWSRYQFDQHVREGLPVVEAAAHKGGEWRVDLLAAALWLEERREQAALRRKRYQEQAAVRQREQEAALERIRKSRWRHLLPGSLR